jgi:hypothetical protein
MFVNKVERMRKKQVMTYLNILSQHFPRGTEGKNVRTAGLQSKVSNLQPPKYKALYIWSNLFCFLVYVMLLGQMRMPMITKIGKFEAT